MLGASVRSQKLIENLFTYCVVPENIDTHPMEAQWKFQGVGGFQKPNFLNESVILKGNFRRGGGSNLKNLPWEGYGYFLEQHILQQKEMRTFTNKNLSLII